MIAEPVAITYAFLRHFSSLSPETSQKMADSVEDSGHFCDFKISRVINRGYVHFVERKMRSLRTTMVDIFKMLAD